MQHEIGPQVDEQRTVDEAEDVGRHSLPQHDLVAAGTLASVTQGVWVSGP